MKKLLSVLLSVIMVLSAVCGVDFSAYAIGSDYWFRCKTPSTNAEIYSDGEHAYFNITDRYIFNWIREQSFYLERYMTPEKLKEYKQDVNNNSQEYELYKDITDSVCSEFEKEIYNKLGLGTNISNVEKIYRIYTYVFLSTQYVLDIDFFDPTAIIYHNGYCMNFSEAIDRLLRMAGIKSYIESSTLIGHAWNEVEIDGKIFVIDCTFADEGFMITPKEFNELWEETAYIGSDSEYKTDDIPSKSNYTKQKLDINDYLKDKSKYWSDSSKYNSEIVVTPVCNGYAITWDNDNTADYYLIRRKVSGKNVEEPLDEYLKAVFPSPSGRNIFVDESPAQYPDVNFEYEVVKQRFDCVTDVYGNSDFTKPSKAFSQFEHQWQLVENLRTPGEGLGADVYECITCKTKMMAYTDNKLCSVHDSICVVDFANNITRDICAKCGYVLGTQGEIRQVDFAPYAQSIKNAKGEWISSKLKSASIKKLTSGKKKFKIILKKASKVSGYQIQCSTSKKFLKPKNVFTKKTKLTVKGLKKKKKYYVRVRSYKTVKGEKVFSSWSKTKTIKIK